MKMTAIKTTADLPGKRWLPLLIIAIVLSLSAGLGMRQPAPPDEPRFVLAARNMVETGQWLLPHRGVELYAEKPPVFMWMQAAAYEITGRWTIAFLLPSLIAALATLWLTYDIGRRLWDERIGRYAALALFSTIQFGLMAKRAQIDMVLVCMTTLSLWGILRHMVDGPYRKGLFLAGFAAGLGTVTKGVGFLPLLMVIPWMAARWLAPKERAKASDWNLLLLVPGFLSGVCVWLVPLGIALFQPHDPALEAYARELLLKQTGTRYVAAWHHVQPAWYFLQVIATLWLPGSLLLVRLVPRWWQRLREGDLRLVLLLGWALLVLVFFSISPGKREVYIFPALPAFCLAAGPLLPAVLGLKDSRTALLIFIAGIGAFALVIAAGCLLDHQWLHGRLAGRDFDAVAVHALGIWTLVLGVALIAVALWSGRARAPLGIVLASCVLWVVYGFGLMPTLDPFSSSSRLMEAVAQRVGDNGEIGMVDWREQNYLQARGSVIDFGFKQPWDVQWERAAQWMKQAPGHRYILVTDKAMSQCANPHAVIEMGQANRNRWFLVPASALRAGCSAHLDWSDPDDE